MDPNKMSPEEKVAFLNKNGWHTKLMLGGKYKVEEQSDDRDATLLYGDEKVLDTAVHIVSMRLAKGHSPTL